MKNIKTFSWRKAFAAIAAAIMAALIVGAVVGCGDDKDESKPREYAVTVANSEFGTVVPSAYKAKKGAKITVTATPDDGYELKSLTAGDEDITDSLQFVMPDKDVTISAVFSAVERLYSVIVNTVGAGTVGHLPSRAKEGDTITVAATPDVGCELVSIVYNDGADHDITDVMSFAMPAHDVSITVTFKTSEAPQPDKEYDITVGETTGGEVSVDKTKAKEGETVTVTVTPADGYELDTLTANGADIKATKTYTVGAGNVEIVATFKKIVYSVGKDSVENGTLEVSKQTAVMGDTVTVTATPDEGYTVSAVTYNDGAQSHDITATGEFTMPAHDVTVSAVFEALPPSHFNVVKATVVNGTLSVDKTSAEEGELVTVTATPAAGYELDTLTYVFDGEPVDIKSSGSFAMPAGSVTVSAAFKKIVYTVSVGATTNGTVTPNAETATIGDEITVTVTPDAGYELDTLTANGNDIKATCKYTVGAGNVTIAATFKKIVYTVTVGTIENGTVTPSAETATMGDEITVTVTPDAGYELDTLTANGNDIKATKKYTVGAGNVEIVATFKKIVYTVSVGTTENGTVTPSSETATMGDEITVTVTPAFGYRLASLTAGGEDITAAKKFTVGTANVTIEATFECVVTSTNFGTVSQAENPYKGRTDNIVNAIDGDPDTATAFNKTDLAAGGYLEYDLGEIVEFDNIIVYPGRKAKTTGELTDSFAGHVVSVAQDGTETTVGSFARGQNVFAASAFSVTKTIDAKLSAAKIRVYIDALPGGWIAVSDIILDGTADVSVPVIDKMGDPVEKTALGGYVDGDTSTATRFSKSNVTIGEGYVGLDLLRTVDIECMRILNGYNATGSDKIFGAVEYYDPDGAQWVEIGTLNALEFVYDTAITARYLRIRVTSAPSWLGLREWYINSLGGIKGIVDISGYSELQSDSGSFKYGLFDGNPDTFAWFSNPGAATLDEATGLHVGKHIDIELFETTEIRKIGIVSDSAGDYFAGYIQYSLDGVNWTEIYHITKEDATMKLENAVTAKYLRFVADRASNWSKIYEIYINAELIRDITCAGGFATHYQGALDNMIDGDENTLMWFGATPDADSYLQLGLSEEFDVSSVRVLSSDSAEGGDSYRGTITYSLDGETWTDLGTVDSNDCTIALETPVKALYIRLMGDGCTSWVKIREITVA